MSNAKGLIYERMAAVMADITHIGKDQVNQAQRFRYRGIDDVYNSMNRLLAKHQIFCTPEVLEKIREERTNKHGTVLAFTCLKMRYSFHTTDGSVVSCVVEGEGMDSGDKSSNKAMAVAHKYALLQTFCIPTAEVKDPDAESHEIVVEKISAIQAEQLAELVDRSGADIARVLKWLKVGSLADLPKSQFARAHKALSEKAGKAA